MMTRIGAHEILESWRRNNRIDLYLIDRIHERGMASTMSARGGRDVARQFVHLHNVRRTWLSMADPRLVKGMAKLDPKRMPAKAQLKRALTASSEAIGRWLTMAIDEGVKMKNFAGGPFAALGYFLAHDSHHRGNILLTLKLSGHRVDTETQYGIWTLWHKKSV